MAPPSYGGYELPDRSRDVTVAYLSSRVCFRWCIVKCVRVEKRLSHSSQPKGRSPLCVLLCAVKCERVVKRLLQSSQPKGRSPVCVLRCSFSEPATLKQLSHNMHWWRFSPECVSRCLLMSTTDLPHTLHADRLTSTIATTSVNLFYLFI